MYLRADEEQVRLIFEMAPIGMALVRPDGHFLQVNPALCRFLGYDADALLATTFQAITHPDDLHADLELVARCLEGSIDGYAIEKRYLHRDGHAVWADLNVAVSRRAGGGPTGFVSQIVDIGARKAAEASLAASEARFAALVEHGSDLISLSDSEGRLVYASPAYRTVLGFDPEERLGLPLLDQVHPDDRDRVTAVGMGLMATPGGSATLDFRYAHADGSWRWAEATMTNRLDDPAVVGFVTNTRDITERVLATERLAHQATHDALTGLPNRLSLEAHLRQAQCEAGQADVVAGLFVDIDHFKSVNDTYGHSIGDRLLAEVAARLRRVARLDDTVVRLGGDEFVVVAGVRNQGAAAELAARVCGAFEQPFQIDDVALAVTVSVGVATTDDLADGLELLDAADLALYEAKAAGRDRWEAYRPQMRRRHARIERTQGRSGDRAPVEVADRYRAQIAGALQPILVHVGGEIVAASPPAVALLHADSDRDLVGRPINSLATDASIAAARSRLRSIATGGWPEPEVVEMATLTGQTIHVEVSSHPALWGGELASQVTMRGVEDRWAEVVRIGAELMESISQAAVITDMHNVVVAWNEEAERVYGWPREEVIGCRLDEVLPWEASDAERDLARSAVQVHGRWEGTVRLRTRGGVLVAADAVSRVIHDRSGVAIGLISVTAPAVPGGPMDEEEVRLLEELEVAITGGQLVMAYQPIVHADGRLAKVEALVRWRHPTRGLLLPADFIPLAERSRLVGSLTAEVLRQSCAQVAAWREAGEPALELAVNVSGRELGDPRLVERVRGALAVSGLPADALWVEVTETAIALDPERAVRGLWELRALGVRVALDDFGTGFATLAQLHQFPAQALKVDRMFVHGITDEGGGDAAIVRSVLALANELGMRVVAEGVETEAQRAALTAMGCELFQGYLFARPAFAEPAPPWLRGRQPASGTQLPWKPSGTRFGSMTRATGPSAGSAAGSTTSSERSVLAS